MTKTPPPDRRERKIEHLILLLRPGVLGIFKLGEGGLHLDRVLTGMTHARTSRKKRGPDEMKKPAGERANGERANL